MLTRRRFIAISAALAPSMALAQKSALHVETGIALGAKVTLRLEHPDAPQLATLAMAEIRRLEQVFSLYLPDSALVRLNREGQLSEPPFELLECLAIAGAVHAASGGRFDPTVQPLWRAEAASREAGVPLSDPDRAAAGALIDWASVRLDPEAITLRPGMGLTLNGIAQGYIADRVAALLAGHGLTRALIDTGEMVALPEGDWPVELEAGGSLDLRNRALSTSAPLGMTFGGDGRTSHILDPRTARPVVSPWRVVTVSAASAALADALSTAACLSEDRETLVALCRSFPSAILEHALPV
ncbi:MAG: FAD:protein FMN transferase [Tabrizicola sp.]